MWETSVGMSECWPPYKRMTKQDRDFWMLLEDWLELSQTCCGLLNLARLRYVSSRFFLILTLLISSSFYFLPSSFYTFSIFLVSLLLLLLPVFHFLPLCLVFLFHHLQRYEFIFSLVRICWLQLERLVKPHKKLWRRLQKQWMIWTRYTRYRKFDTFINFTFLAFRLFTFSVLSIFCVSE